jgi:hypothetical protein
MFKTGTSKHVGLTVGALARRDAATDDILDGTFKNCLRLVPCQRPSQMQERILDFEQNRQCAACADWDPIPLMQVSEYQADMY